LQIEQWAKLTSICLSIDSTNDLIMNLMKFPITSNQSESFSSVSLSQDSIGKDSQTETVGLTGSTKPERSKVSVREVHSNRSST